jgi:hypothetical protein
MYNILRVAMSLHPDRMHNSLHVAMSLHADRMHNSLRVAALEQQAQQSVGSHVTALWHIDLIQIQPVFALIP